MRNYMPERQKIIDFVVERLKIGSHCVLCAGSGVTNRDLCDVCESLLIRTQHTNRAGFSSRLCLNCGNEQGWNRQLDAVASPGSENLSQPYDSGAVCEHCSGGFGAFVRIVAPYRYAFPLKQMIKRLKYGDQRAYARVMGTLLAASVSQDARVLPQCLIPMPLHATRLHNRGFNQAAEIARWCAQDLDLRTDPKAVTRLLDTGSMAGLSRAERQIRIMGAFRAEDWVVGQHLAIVDDVLTTGASARELARELYDTGAESVELWVLARTSSNRGWA